MTSDKEQLRDISSIGMLSLLILFFGSKLLYYSILQITGTPIGNQRSVPVSRSLSKLELWKTGTYEQSTVVAPLKGRTI